MPVNYRAMMASSTAVMTVIGLWMLKHLHRRQRLMMAKLELMAMSKKAVLGGDLQLSEKELLANEAIMKAKCAEVDEGFTNASSFNPAHHFFKRKPHIDRSPLFKHIKQMPKGAILHAHDTALLGSEYLLEVTYRDDLYVNQDEMQLRFFKTPPNDSWKLLRDARNEAGDVQEFDRRLTNRFTMVTENPEVEYSDVEVAWQKFESIFTLITPMLAYKPVWEEYFYEALRQFRQDGVFYLEFRTTLPDLYDLEGNVYGPVECAKIYKAVNDRFKRDYPDSFGARFIYAPLKMVTLEQIRQYVLTSLRLKRELGDFFLGFDLVGQESKGWTLAEIQNELSQLVGKVDTFYHVGETNWFGTTHDNNLYDAIALGARRLGHAYALPKHPVLAQIVKQRDIAVEVSPISNQVLRLVQDLRNHPAAVMFAHNYPMVISSDDPGLWGALPASHDYYVAFLGIASRDSDIRLLKQLIFNTVKYSCMPDAEKTLAKQRLESLWDAFLDDVLMENDDRSNAVLISSK